MEQLHRLSKKLHIRGYNTEIFKHGKLAVEKLYELIQNHTVGFGGSMTLKKLNVINNLDIYAKNVFYHLPGQAGDDERKALTADFYLTSVNAVSLDGHIVNIDGTGNRTAATCFGPKEIIYFIGKNKITPTLEKAIFRAKDTAVKLAKYYKRNTPCVKTGKCEDCLTSECICSITTIHRKKPAGIKSTVFLINEELGM